MSGADHKLEQSMSSRTWSMLFGLSLLWGCSFPFVKVAVAGVPPMTLVLARVAIAAVVLLPVLVLAREKFPRGRALWGAFFAMALLNNLVPWTLSFWAQQFIPSALAAILNAATPLLSVVVGHFMLEDEPLRANRFAGVIVGLIGVAVLIGPGALLDRSKLLAELALLGAAASYAFSGVVGRRFAKLGASALQSAFGQMSAGALMMAPLALAIEQPWTLPVPTTAQIEAVAGLAILSTAAAYLLFFRILARAGATNVMLVTLLVPPTAILVGWFFLGEKLEPQAFVGLAFIAGGLALIDGRLLSVIRAKFAAPAPGEDARKSKLD
jgi:drug/metabolite transporter (DMT)-like permease